MFEPQKFSPQGGGLRRVLDKGMLQLTPLLKTPASLMMDREFFRGKDLGETTRISGRLVSENIPGITKVETKRGPEYHLDKGLTALKRSSPFSRQFQFIGDVTGETMDPMAALVGVRIRNLDPERSKKQYMLEKYRHIFEENPEIREFKKYFSIAKEPSAGVKAMLKRYREVNQ
jgi:hypothetical protein